MFKFKKTILNKKNEPPKKLPTPVVGEDYYIENGLYVFTAAYHKKRGYCCGSGCRHCPYDKDNTTT